MINLKNPLTCAFCYVIIVTTTKRLIIQEFLVIYWWMYAHDYGVDEFKFGHEIA